MYEDNIKFGLKKLRCGVDSLQDGVQIWLPHWRCQSAKFKSRGLHILCLFFTETFGIRRWHIWL